jgi:hypothetical protein
VAAVVLQVSAERLELSLQASARARAAPRSWLMMVRSSSAMAQAWSLPQTSAVQRATVPSLLEVVSSPGPAEAVM